MRKIEEIGTCPNCDCSVYIYKTNNYKRFAKCEICGLSYALPKRGSISNSALLCPTKRLPILIVEKKDQKAYLNLKKSPDFKDLMRFDSINSFISSAIFPYFSL